MSVGILGTALSGLAAFQRSLETTSNNISNVNTEGYSRQRTELATRPEQFTGTGYLGQGVATANITRSYDQFITNQVRSSNSAFGEVDTYHTLSAQIDNLVADESTSLGTSIKAFFDTVHGVANDPASIPSREALLGEANSLAQNFNTMGGRFSAMRQQVNDDMAAIINDVNDFARSLADLNVKIVADIGRSSGKQQPNNLLDQRDSLLSQIAEKVDVSVVAQGDGSVSVFIGQGQTLVLGNYASTLSLENGAVDPFRKEIALNGQTVTRQLSGGELFGHLRFRDEVLDPAQRSMGLLAAGLAIEFNGVQQNGYDLNGEAGGPLFSLGTPEITVTGSNPLSSLQANFMLPVPPLLPSAKALQASDYQLTVTGPGSYNLTRLSDNTLIASSQDEGFDLVLDGNEVAGDTFLIRPTFNAALGIQAVIKDPRKIAAAQDFDPGPPLAGLPGDNRNALALANLETSKKLLGGSANFSETYGQLVSKVGTLTHTAQVSRSAQEVLLRQSKAARESIAGVNLDEEAANLILFQNAYQASAQVVSVANSLFDALLGAVR